MAVIITHWEIVIGRPRSAGGLYVPDTPADFATVRLEERYPNTEIPTGEFQEFQVDYRGLRNLGLEYGTGFWLETITHPDALPQIRRMNWTVLPRTRDDLGREMLDFFKRLDPRDVHVPPEYQHGFSVFHQEPDEPPVPIQGATLSSTNFQGTTAANGLWVLKYGDDIVGQVFTVKCVKDGFTDVRIDVHLPANIDPTIEYTQFRMEKIPGYIELTEMQNIAMSLMLAWLTVQAGKYFVAHGFPDISLGLIGGISD